MDCTLRGESCKPCVHVFGDHAYVLTKLAGISKECELKTKMAITESERLRTGSNLKTSDNSDFSKLQLNQRFDHVKFLYDELEMQKKAAIAELGELQNFQQRLEIGINSVRTFLSISEQCLNLRAGMNDEVNVELGFEQNNGSNVLLNLLDINDEFIARIRKMRGAIACLDIDLEDKSEALCVDQECLSEKMNVSQFHYPPYESTQNEWQQQSQANIYGMSKIISNSQHYRITILGAIATFNDSLNESWMRTTSKLENMIQTNSRLLEKVRADAIEFAHYENQLSIEEDKRFAQIRELDVRHQLATFRLANRTQRIGMEKCDDNTEVALIREIRDLDKCRDILRDEHEHSMQLRRHWVQLTIENKSSEKDIVRDLEQDKSDCLPLRKNFIVKL